jgi:hypothetical protein
MEQQTTFDRLDQQLDAQEHFSPLASAMLQNDEGYCYSDAEPDHVDVDGGEPSQYSLEEMKSAALQALQNFEFSDPYECKEQDDYGHYSYDDESQLTKKMKAAIGYGLSNRKAKNDKKYGYGYKMGGYGSPDYPMYDVSDTVKRMPLSIRSQKKYPPRKVCHNNKKQIQYPKQYPKPAKYMSHKRPSLSYLHADKPDTYDTTTDEPYDPKPYYKKCKKPSKSKKNKDKGDSTDLSKNINRFANNKFGDLKKGMLGGYDSGQDYEQYDGGDAIDSQYSMDMEELRDRAEKLLNMASHQPKRTVSMHNMANAAKYA